MPSDGFNKLNKYRGLSRFIQIENIDKVVHYGLFFCLSMLLYQAYRIRSWYLILIPFAISFLIEVFQGVLPFNRSYDVWDLAANLSGIVTAYFVIQLVLYYKKNRS